MTEYRIDYLCYHTEYHYDEMYTKVCSNCVVRYLIKRAFPLYKKNSKILKFDRLRPVTDSFLQSLIKKCDYCELNIIAYFCNFTESALCPILNMQKSLLCDGFLSLEEDVPLSNVVLRFLKDTPEALDPFQAYGHSAGLDLASVEDCVIPAGGQCLLSTGLKFQFPTGCYGRLASRSSLASKHSIHVGAGVIDPDYRGVVKVLLVNTGTHDYNVKKGERIAQMILENMLKPELEEVYELNDTQRSISGFGSSTV